ncbi:MAG: hypothetical protein M1339_04335 [Bacteroidetes bacterium]|nr:hypothetical protein [Bacteroidota bacterium]
MVPVLIFWMHIVAGVYLFVKRYYEETLGEAFLSIIFAAIIFTAGWTLSSFIVHFVFTPQGLGPALRPDSLSLVLLTFLEAIFYKIWFSRPGSNSSPEADRAADA